jgi:hypothetical protein
MKQGWQKNGGNSNEKENSSNVSRNADGRKPDDSLRTVRYNGNDSG